MIIYRLLTGEDDAKFCHKVTRALSEGWELYGDPQYAYSGWAAPRCAQAVIKKVEDQPYDENRKLSEY